jgi:hypothetical protein
VRARARGSRGRGILEAIKRAKTAAPEGISDEDYASVLRSETANLYASDALLTSNAPSDMKMLEQALAELKPLAEKNDQIVGAAFDDLDASDVGNASSQICKPRIKVCKRWPIAIQASVSRKCSTAKRAPPRRSRRLRGGSMS